MHIVAISDSTCFENSQFSYDGWGRNVKILEYTSSSLTSTKMFVWCDDQRCEARNASSTITAQYFAFGETISGTSYYFTKDSPPGSTREVTNSSGTIVYQLAYDPYGQPTTIQGSVPPDFQFAGYYLHAPSGLSVTVSRAYSSKLGRFINRDPIEESGGVNLFAYAGNEPISNIDPTGHNALTLEAGAAWLVVFIAWSLYTWRQISPYMGTGGTVSMPTITIDPQWLPQAWLNPGQYGNNPTGNVETGNVTTGDKPWGTNTCKNEKEKPPEEIPPLPGEPGFIGPVQPKPGVKPTYPSLVEWIFRPLQPGEKPPENKEDPPGSIMRWFFPKKD